MSLTNVIILLSLTGAAGIGFGYFLRWIISLGKRGSMELEIKQMMLDAQEKAKTITDEASERAEEKIAQLTSKFDGRERDLKQEEERLVRKEELLDKRQLNLDTEQETLLKKASEIQESKERADKVLSEQQQKLEQIAHLSAEQAKDELIRNVERQYETDIEMRMRKLEVTSNERLERRANEILTTAVHRLGNSVVSDVLTTTITIPND
jgi:ribonucrease Y